MNYIESDKFRSTTPPEDVIEMLLFLGYSEHKAALVLKRCKLGTNFMTWKDGMTHEVRFKNRTFLEFRYVQENTGRRHVIGLAFEEVNCVQDY